MNCFEARQEFTGFWRRTIAAERRAELLAHLHECAKCDRAFRIFALTAPALHSEPPAHDTPQSVPATANGFPFGAAARRIAVAPRPAAPRWMAIAAAVAIFVLSGAAAELARYTPAPSLGDAISTSTNPAAPDAVADPFGLDQSTQVSGLAG